MSVTVTVTGDYDKWLRRFGDLPNRVAEASRVPWAAATEMFFSRTQDAVHVISGDLKASGDYSIDVDRGQVEGTVTYDEEYAIFEHRLEGGKDATMPGAGLGSHNWITKVWPPMIPIFEQALAQGWEATWRD